MIPMQIRGRNKRILAEVLEAVLPHFPLEQKGMQVVVIPTQTIIKTFGNTIYLLTNGPEKLILQEARPNKLDLASVTWGMMVMILITYVITRNQINGREWMRL